MPAVPRAAPTRRPLVVASVPAAHVYVRHTLPIDDSRVRHLVDPDPDDTTRPAGARWWPPAMLEPAWAGESDFDVFHLHFGFDTRTPEELVSLVSTLREQGRPLVYTVHDLRNPHHLDRSAHDAQLDVLVPGADRLITLTRGAADEVRRRWGRECAVVPHPHVVDLPTMARFRDRRRAGSFPGASGGEFRIGVHLKSLRPSMEPLPVLRTLVELVPELSGGILQVNVHRDVVDPGGQNHDAEVAGLVADLDRLSFTDVRVHDFLSDADLWEYLSGLDVSVLPYRHGTHSGWLEACRDLGTTVIAPTCGYYADQGPILSYDRGESALDEVSLIGAVRRAHAERPDLGTTVEARRAQRHQIAAAHDQIYRSLVRG